MKNLKVQHLLLGLTSLLFLVGCGKNYSGQYIGLTQEVQTIYKNSRGEVYKQPPLAFGMPEGLHVYYVYTLMKNILSLKQEKDGFTGNFVVTDDKTLIEFLIKTGYVDKDKRLHLKMTFKPDANVGIGFMGMSVSGSLGEMLLNLDEVPSPEKSKISFKVTGSIDLLSGLFPAGQFQSEQILTLEKYQESETENEVNKFKKLLAEISTKDLHRLIDEKNYYGAMVSRDLLTSLGENVPEEVVTQINAIKEAYVKEMPEMLKKSIKFTPRGVAEASSLFSGVYNKLSYDVENTSDFKITMLHYSITCRDTRNKKIVDTGTGIEINMAPKSIKNEGQRLETDVPEKYLACEYKATDITLPRFER